MKPAAPDVVTTAVKPDYALGVHVAPLGLAFSQGAPAGPPIELLGGFVSADGDAYGRPVGLAFDRHGALLVADDVGNVVWRVTGAGIAS